MTGILDFNVLDGLAFAAERRRLSGDIPDHVARDLGPVIEMGLLAHNGLLPPPEAAGWLQLSRLGAFYTAIKSGKRQWTCPDTRHVGFLRTERDIPENETMWTRFGLSAQQAAVNAGFPGRIARKLAAALGELHSNIYEHSGASATGLIAFCARPGHFEFAISDRGVGVLRSLQNCAHYSSLDDHGRALRLALTEGVSRHGVDIGRGYGFRSLFIGLANLNGSLRFRSGDHALVIDGTNPSLVSARTAQKTMLNGLFISVVCNHAGSKDAP